MKDNIKIIYDDNTNDNSDDENINTTKKGGIFRKIFFISLLIIILIIIYSRYIGTSGLIVKEYNIKNKDIKESFNGFKIAHFSDVHYGRTTNLDSIKTLIKEINLTKPDIIVFTGDLIDKGTKISDSEIQNIKNELMKLDSKYGKYYISGEHDIKFDSYNEIFQYAGFMNLDNKYDIIYNENNDSILLTGTKYDEDPKYLEDLFKQELPTYKINIMHMGDKYEEIKKYNYNLILAGHSHNGQICIPFYGAIYKKDGSKNYYKPHYKIDNTDIYILSGIGTSDFSFRLFNRPSFNLYRIN